MSAARKSNKPPRAASPDRAAQTAWKARAALFAIALVAYSGSFGLGLVQDSRPIVTQDARIQAATAENLKLILSKNYWWPKVGDGLYRPVTTATYLLNYAVLGNGPNPAGYHVVNFLLHTLNAWLVLELALLLFGNAQAAFFAAALWAVHPICTEAVANVVGRADLLAATAVLGGLLLYARATRREGNRPGAAAALFAASAIGVFSKENAVVLVGLMLLWDLAFTPGDWRAGVARRWWFYAAAAAPVGLLWLARRQVLSAFPLPQAVFVDNPLHGAGFWAALLTAIKVIGLDLWLLVFPLQLASDRSYNQVPIAGWGDALAWLALLVVGAILVTVVVRRRQEPLLFWAAGFFALTLLPTSNLVFLIGATMAERFLYLPSVAFAVALVALLQRVGRTRLSAAVAVLAVLYVGRTFARTQAWKDDLTLASHDLATSPHSFRLHDMLAKALLDQDGQRNLDRAIAEEEASWAIIRPLPLAQSSEFPPAFLGIFYALKAASPATAAPDRRAWYEKSVAVLVRARAISEANARAFDQAQLAAGRPLTSRSGFSQLYFNLANDYLNLGRYAEALEASRYGRILDPRAPEAYDGLVLAYLGLNQPQASALILLEKARIEGFTPQTISALRDVYARMPGGECAVAASNGLWGLNLDCPRVRGDLCAASADLAHAFEEARDSGRAGEIRASAIQTYGCSAAQLAAVPL